MRRVEKVLFIPLVRRTAVAATVASILLALGGPLTLYIQTHRALSVQADSSAKRMAELVQRVVIELPDLWFYATPKLARHIRDSADEDIVQVLVIGPDGVATGVPSSPPHSAWLVRWAEAPVFRGEEVVRVWVAVDGTAPMTRVLVITVLSLLLSAFLSTFLYVLPIRLVDRAQKHIGGLLSKLENTSEALAALNEELEERVEQRSEALAETAEMLRQREAQLRELAARATEATEQERQRVALELHDGAGQVLTAIRLSLQVLGTTVEKDSPTEKMLIDTKNLVDGAIDELRRIAMALHPATLDRLGLLEGLRELTDGVATRASISMSFKVRGVPEELPTAVQSSCFRLVQECLTNIIRYAEATEVFVELDGTKEPFLRVSVEDDGKGFDLDQHKRGLGLGNMEDRVTLLGGRIEINSAPGRGTRVEAWLPLDVNT